MTGPAGPYGGAAQPTTPDKPPRPDDVVTGFWLWVAALPLLVTGYITDAVVTPTRGPVWLVVLLSLVFMVVLATVVVTFLMLMRAGYRWARSALTGGAIVSIGMTVGGLFTTTRPTVAALIFAVSGIFGVVLLAGGLFLLHRKDAQAYFTR